MIVKITMVTWRERETILLCPVTGFRPLPVVRIVWESPVIATKVSRSRYFAMSITILSAALAKRSIITNVKYPDVASQVEAIKRHAKNVEF